MVMEEIKVPFSTETTPAGNYLKGTGLWRPFWFENKNNSKKIMITAKWQGKRDNQHKFQTVGIFVPIEDFPVENSTFAGKHTYIVKENQGNAGIIKADKWDFGNIAKIEIHECDNKGTGQIAGLIRCNPTFISKQDNSILQLTLKQMDDYGSWNEVESVKFKFRPCEDEEEQDQSFILNEIERLEGLSLDGIGNSIHPKQIFTIKGIEKAIHELQKPRYDIAYIGVDTSENLRSIIRYLKNNKEILKMITTFTVFATKSWDEELLDLLGNKYSIDGIKLTDKVKVKIVKLDKDTEELPKDVEINSTDIIIATYVTPWVNKSDTKNQLQYKNLLKKLMTTESILISTDPSNSHSSVRSSLSEKNEDINLNTFYKLAMDFKPDLKLGNTFRFENSISQKCWRLKS
tara:strand:- start:223 stop:1431 length:1209 start_codon:yes stop_codon:yes gene_type:complete